MLQKVQACYIYAYVGTINEEIVSPVAYEHFFLQSNIACVGTLTRRTPERKPIEDLWFANICVTPSQRDNVSQEGRIVGLMHHSSLSSFDRSLRGQEKLDRTNMYASSPP